MAPYFLGMLSYHDARGQFGPRICYLGSKSACGVLVQIGQVTPRMRPQRYLLIIGVFLLRKHRESFGKHKYELGR